MTKTTVLGLKYFNILSIPMNLVGTLCILQLGRGLMAMNPSTAQHLQLTSYQFNIKLKLILISYQNNINKLPN